MQRRALVMAAPALVTGLCGLLPRSAQAASSFASDWGITSPLHKGKPAPLPHGYAVMGQRTGVPPLVLYGVALQESAKLFGPLSLPWPWTLNVRGEPRRFVSYASAVIGLRDVLASGVRNVDVGPMQVNWGYHHDKLLHPGAALDPYPNILVGARILRGHFDQTGNWVTAVGRYHSPGNLQRANQYAALVYKRMAQVPAHSTPAGSARG
jgi:soluble lytic murein transglycosylase-like protein